MIANARIDPALAHSPGSLYPKFSPSAPPPFLTTNSSNYVTSPPYNPSFPKQNESGTRPSNQQPQLGPSPPPQQQGTISVPMMDYSVPGAIQYQQPPIPQPPPAALKPMAHPPPAPNLNEVSLNEERQHVRCPYCHASIHTKISYSIGTMTHIAAGAVLVVFFPLAWIPYVVDCCKDVNHACPNCGRIIGRFKRFT